MSADHSIAGAPMQRRGGGALWKQIAATLEAEIRGGRHEPGARLPTELELARRFGVNRHTLRRAVSALQDEGLLRVEQGRGTFVHEAAIDYRVQRRTRFSETVRGLGRQPGGTLLRAEIVPADPPTAAALGIARTAPVVVIEIVHLVDGRPVSVTSHCFPKGRFEGLIAAYRATGSITEALARCGVRDYFRRSTRVSARLPTPQDARHLRMARNQPVVVSENVNVDESGRVIEYAVSRCVGQRMQLVFEP